MTVEVRSFSPVIATGSTPGAPVTVPLTFPARVVLRVDVRIPPGPRGELGVQLAVSGQQVVPYQSGQWLVMDDETVSFDLRNFPNSGAWQLIAYNTGAFSHTVYLRFHLDTVQQSTAPLQPVTITAPIGV